MDASRMWKSNRRAAIGGGLAGIAGLAWTTVAAGRGRAINQRGIVGGGRVRYDEGEADFSVFASRVIVDGEEPGVVRGSVRWVDAAGLTMRSVKIADYKDLELPSKQGEGRRTIGTMRVSGEGQQPFMLEVIDAGDPGSGRDTVELIVGVAARNAQESSAPKGSGFRYRASGAMVSGDVQIVELEIANAGQ